jgi:Ca2+-binding EF-hand superfamily protein
MAPSLFEELDSNHNGAISKTEAAARMDLSNNFDSIDKNGNGSLSVDEYTAYENKGRMVPEEVEVPEPGAAPVPSY